MSDTVASLSVNILAKDELSAVLAKLEGQLQRTNQTATRSGRSISEGFGGGAQRATSSILSLQQAQARLEAQQGNLVGAAQRLRSALAQVDSTTVQSIGAQRQLLAVETQLATGTSRLGNVFAEAGSAAKANLLGMVGPAALATAGIGAAVGVVQSFADAFKFKAELDATTASINAQLKGVRDTSQVYAQASAFATKFKLTQEETTNAISASIGVMRNSKASVEDILSVLARLQVLSPEQSLEEAAVAIKALASGDTTSLVTRFEVGRDVASQMKQEIAGGADAVAVLNTFLNNTGIGMDALAAKTTGAAGALRDVAIAQEQLALAQAEFAQGPGIKALEIQTTLTTGLTRLLGGGGGIAEGLRIAAAQWMANIAASHAYSDALVQGQTRAEASAAAQAAYNASIQQGTQETATATQQVAAHAAGQEAYNAAIAAGQSATQAAAAFQQAYADALVQTAPAQAAGTTAFDAYRTAALAAGAALDQARTQINAVTGELQTNAQAAVLAAAQQNAQQQATAALTAETNAAVNAFLALNPNVDAAGIASAIAAGKIPPLVGQLAAMQVQADATAAALGRLAAQQAGVQGLQKLFAEGAGNQKGSTAGVSGRIGGGFSQQLAASDALRQSERDLALARAGNAAEQIKLLQAQADKTLDLVEKNRLLARIEGLRDKGKGGGGGGAPKLTAQEKLNNQLLASDEQFQQKSEDAERAHQQRILDIQAEFAKRIADAQENFAQSQLEGRAGFYDSLGSIEDAGLRQALSAQYEAAFQEADQIAREKGADVGQAFLEARQQALEAQASRASEIQQATDEGDKGKAEYLRGVDKLYRDAEERKLARIKEGQGSIASEQDTALAEEDAKYQDAQDKLALSSERSADRAVTAAQRRGDAVDAELLKVSNLATAYSTLGAPVGGTQAGGPLAATPTTTPTVSPPTAPSTAATLPDLIASLMGKIDGLQSALVAAEKSGADQIAGSIRNLSGLVR